MKDKYSPLYEQVLQDTIFPELEKGRPNWDKPHTVAVVYYTKEIIRNSNLKIDEDVQIIASYAHDWGYSGLFHAGKKVDLEAILDVKSEHMKIGAEKIDILLSNEVFNFLSSERKNRAIHLVRVHDKLKELRDTDELLLMEADTLGALDVDMIKPFEDKKSGDRYMSGVKRIRYPLFITDYGKMKFKELFEKRINYYTKI